MSPTEEKTELVPRGLKLLKFRTLFTFLARLFVLCIQFFKGEPRNTTPYFRNKQFLAISNSFSFRHFARTKKGPRICLATVCILFAIYFGICSNDGRIEQIIFDIVVFWTRFGIFFQILLAIF